MGIPKFFRWMSERYPGLLMTAKEYNLPEIDNFYLDMNGIIHNCSHPNDGDVHFRINEAEMFDDIFNYIDTLLKIIKPRGVFFMAVDGVAPRAKMNQQRGRRFRTAKEASDREEAALKKGQVLPSEQRFDSNCITPGTEFMIKLNNAMKKMIRDKMTNDPAWQKVEVILSGHETPGEGEHKIMDFIRYKRSQPDYNPDTSHCLYGLDTDLIMLALSSHEPNFMLLREEVKLNGKKSDATKGKSQRVDPSRISFNVLYLTLLRDYIERDFLPLKAKMQFKFDLEAIIDDWILICFLIGNDFIPHLPHFHIHKNALPKIFEVYRFCLERKLTGYLNEKGMLNLKRFRIFAKELSVSDFENYQMLLKENGGECAKDDFSKLNMFVRNKVRVIGIDRRQNQRRPPGQRFDLQSNHAQRHQPEVWYNIQNKAGGRHYAPALHNGMRAMQIRNYSTPNKSNNAHTDKGQNGATPGRVGVHSFSEAQINNSITVCADGDIIDISDDEYLSDERFPNERHKQPANPRPRPMTNTDQHRHAPRIDRRSAPAAAAAAAGRKEQSKPATDMDNFKAYKQTYYREKFKIDPDRNSITKVVNEYVRALQWNLHYYYHGCISWGWYYPYHYAPFISDIVNFKEVDMRFEMGEPFKPFDQLLSVLPAASCSLLPRVYRNLVTSGNSPLAEYFPTEVEYDLNGKQNDWEAVVLAPFIDQDALLKASDCYKLFLTAEERSANIHGPHFRFYYERPKSGKRVERNTIAELTSGKVVCEKIDKDEFFMPIDKIKFGLLKDKQEAKAPQKNRRGGPTERNGQQNQGHQPYNKTFPASSVNAAGFPILAFLDQKLKEDGFKNGPRRYGGQQQQSRFGKDQEGAGQQGQYSYRNPENNHHSNYGHVYQPHHQNNFQNNSYRRSAKINM